MGPQKRKLLQQYGDGTAISEQAPPSHRTEPVVFVLNSASATSQKVESPFGSSMAITVLILLTALFFMVFFSIYIRRFARDSATQISRRRSRLRGLDSTAQQPTLSAVTSSSKGLDPEALQSLPVQCYDAAADQHRIRDCAICLGELAEGESVRVMPSCSHVFHVQCIDTWLTSHVSCPVCRATQLFPDARRGLCRLHRERVDGGGSTVEGVDTRGDSGEVSVRRITSCSSLGQTAALHRTSSF